MSTRQKHPAHSSKSKNRPRFVNPVPLPAVAEFRLDNILTKVLPQETAAVSSALSEVCDNYQKDLKGEIRKALAIEQKIQNKNIHAIKQTHKLTKQLHNKRKQLMRLNAGKGDSGKSKNMSKRGNPGLAAEVDEVLAQSISISTNVKALALKMADISANKGGSGIPDMQKYPRLNKLLASIRPETGENGKSDIEEGENQLPISTPVCVQENRENVDEDDHSLNNKSRIMENHDDRVSPELESSHPIENDINDVNSAQNTSLSIWETDPSAGSRVNQNPQSPQASENGDEAMDSCAFEMFMDSSIAKYRERQEQRSRTSVSSFSETGSGTGTDTGTGSRPARNPLRLLSSGAIGLGNQQIKSSPFLEQSDSFKYSFLPRKSAATVLETNQSSLHKKLRIRVLPSAHKTPADSKCGCRSENKPKTSASDMQENNDIWSSSKVISGAYSATDLETETETDSVSGISSSSDANSSSESVGSNIGETNRYYLSLQSNLRSKRKSRRHRRSRKLGTRNQEMSPTLKHEPSHRVLQPKQSILKLTKGKEDANTLKASVEIEPQSPDRSQMEELKYMSSPRASLTNECAVSGMIVQGAVSEDLEIGDGEYASEEELENSSQIENHGISGEEIVDGLSRGNRVGPSQALDKLKSLVL